MSLTRSLAASSRSMGVISPARGQAARRPVTADGLVAVERFEEGGAQLVEGGALRLRKLDALGDAVERLASALLGHAPACFQRRTGVGDRMGRCSRASALRTGAILCRC